MGQMATMDRTGDTKTIWNADIPAEVAAAKKTFDDLRTKGYAAYKVNEDGSKGTLIRTFDPDAQSLIMALPLKGG